MPLLTAIGRNAFLLSLFAIVTATVLALVYQQTYSTIELVKRQVEANTLAELISNINYDNDVLESTIQLSAIERKLLNLEAGANAYYASLTEAGHNSIQAFIIPSIAVDGYSGDIRMLIGIGSNGRISGLRVTDHSETPGLGDKVNLKKSPWVLSFNNKGFDNLAAEHWAVKKDGGEFDGFTGATVTPRAVIKQAKKTLQLFHQNKDQWSLNLEYIESTKQKL